MNIYIFLGPPGVGKGSLSQLCVENLGWVQLSTGNLCRSHVANKTEIGKNIDFIINSGKLIPDSLIIEMVSDWLKNNSTSNSSIILDGYPRTVVQAKSLNELLEKKFNDCDVNIVKLTISEKDVIARLTTRLICSNNKCQAVYSTVGQLLIPKKMNLCDKCSSALMRRNDDEEKFIKERLLLSNKNEAELIQYYSEIGQEVLNLNVEKPLSDVFSEFKRLIN